MTNVSVPLFLTFFEPLTLTFLKSYCPYEIKDKHKTISRGNFSPLCLEGYHKMWHVFCNQHLHKQLSGSDLIQNTVILIYQ